MKPLLSSLLSVTVLSMFAPSRPSYGALFNQKPVSPCLWILGERKTDFDNFSREFAPEVSELRKRGILTAEEPTLDQVVVVTSEKTKQRWFLLERPFGQGSTFYFFTDSPMTVKSSWTIVERKQRWGLMDQVDVAKQGTYFSLADGRVINLLSDRLGVGRKVQAIRPGEAASIVGDRLAKATPGSALHSLLLNFQPELVAEMEDPGRWITADLPVHDRVTWATSRQSGERFLVLMAKIEGEFIGAGLFYYFTMEPEELTGAKKKMPRVGMLTFIDTGRFGRRFDLANGTSLVVVENVGAGIPGVFIDW